MNLQKELFKLQDEEYRMFFSKINPSIDIKTIIGVRTPDFRKVAKSFYKEGNYEKFFKSLPHKYYEENNIHGFLISQIKDYDECIKELNIFLPYIDNWATCDTLRPKVFDKNKDKLIKDIKKWLKSKKIYTVRFAIEMLMTFYLDDDFDPSYLELVSKVRSKEYYVNMMIAWFFATALAKQRNDTIKYVETKKLDDWTHNKTIRKAIESNRISAKDKKYLKSLKVKNG